MKFTDKLNKAINPKYAWGIIQVDRQLGLMSDTGWGNGYVAVTKDHPMFGVDYERVDVSVHGGLTYSNRLESDGIMIAHLSPMISPIEAVNWWVFGFDTAHIGDGQWNEEAVRKETLRLMKQLRKLEKKPKESL